MKRLTTLILSLVMILGCVIFSSCSSTKSFVITFVQDGQENIVYTVNTNGDLDGIPNPVSKDGYTVQWEINDFSKINEDVTVNAIYTPNKYVITYEVNTEHASVSANSQTVTFNSEFTLLTPTTTLSNYTFSHWKLKDSGAEFSDNTVYSLARDIVVVAVWKPVGGSDWSDNA